MAKRYYWLKLHDDFFSSKRIKKLRKMAGGDTYTIIYLKMQLLAMHTDGVLEWSGLEDTFADELALDLDESPENVQVTLAYLLSCGLAETSDNVSFFFPYTLSNTGSENASAQRVREYRDRQKALQCNADVTRMKRDGNAEIEKEIEIDTREEKEIEIDTREEKEITPPRKKYGEYKNVLLTDEDLDKLKAECPNYEQMIERLSSYMASTGKTYKNHLATIRNWARRDAEQAKAKQKEEDQKNGLVEINGVQYLYKNGQYYVPHGSGVPVNPFREDDEDDWPF